MYHDPNKPLINLNRVSGIINLIDQKPKREIRKDDTYRRLEARMEKWMELHKDIPVVYAILKNVKEVVFNGAKMY